MNLNISEGTDFLVNMLTVYGMSVAGAITILVIGFIASKWVSGIVSAGLSKVPNFDVTLRQFIVSLVKYAILIFTGIAVLSKFGVQTASLVAVLGAMGLAIGLAMQGTLSHVAAGVMLLLFRPFKVGDYVEAGGHAGTVQVISLFTTEMTTLDNIQIVVPNGNIWGDSVINYTINPTRRAEIVLGIAYEADINQAMKAINEELVKEERILKDPETFVGVTNLGESSVDITVRMWCKRTDFWQLKCDMTKALKERMDKEDISIPYPQRTLHVVNGDLAETAKKSVKKAS